MNSGDDAHVFLFTDIEGSTPLWERFPETMPDVLARHDTLIAGQLEQYGGRIVKHTGDGVFAVFVSGDPLRCAIEIQRRMRAEAWPAIGELRVRIALHAGPAELFNRDYFGPTINRAARILSASWGGQILLTSEVKERCPLPEHAWLEDHGSHLLKDLIDYQPLYGLLHPDLIQTFPPLRSLSAQPNNLPQQSTPFVGRSAELHDLGELLVQGGCRLLTLIGPGGMGKTRTSIQTAAEYADRFPHGVYFVPLAPLTSHEFLTSAIASAISARLPQTDDLLGHLIRYIAQKRMLLVLDNFEHLLEGAALLGDIVGRTPSVQLLVTSRERLGLQAECLYELGGLQIPGSVDAAVFEEFEAVDMFIAYARRHQPSYTLAAADRPAVLQICRLLGGMPLGIQLAAAWVRTLPPAEIAAELAADLDFLASSLRDLPERHRSMRAVFEYSWNLLREAERDAFARLSVFRGGFTAAAAKQVAGASLPVLMTLVDKSLIQRDASGRYQMHELLRQYAEQKLEESTQEAQRVHDRHSTYFSELLASQMEIVASGGLQRVIIAEMIPEQDNLRAMWNWSITHARAEDIMRAALPLEFLLQIQTRYLEGAESYEAAAQNLAAHYPDGAADLALAEVMGHAAWFRIRLGHLERARQEAERSIALLRQALGAPVSHFGLSPLAALAIILSLTGDYKKAIAVGEELRQLAEGHPNPFNTVQAHYAQVGPYVALGRYDDAKRHAEAALAAYAYAGDDWFQAYLYNELANVLRLLGEYALAEKYARQSYQIKQEFDDQEGMAVARNLLAQLMLERGDYAGAYDLFEQSVSTYQEIGDAGGLATTLNGLGLASLLKGDHAAARGFFRRALETAAGIDYASLMLTTLLRIAELWLRTDREPPGRALLAYVGRQPATDYETQTRARALLERIAPGVERAPDPPVDDSWAGDLKQVATSVLEQLEA